MKYKLYIPSNGTEGEGFMSQWCDKCIRHPINPDAKKQCSHLRKSIFGEQNDKWIWANDEPICLAYKNRQEVYKSRQTKQNKKQLELFAR